MDGGWKFNQPKIKKNQVVAAILAKLSGFNPTFSILGKRQEFAKKPKSKDGHFSGFEQPNIHG